MDLSKSQLQALADSAERIAIDGGTLIIGDDQPGDAAYLLVKGRAARLDGIGRPMEPLPIGTMVGEMAMLIETRHTATVVAIEPIKALKFTRSRHAGRHAGRPRHRRAFHHEVDLPAAVCWLTNSRQSIRA